MRIGELAQPSRSKTRGESLAARDRGSELGSVRQNSVKVPLNLLKDSPTCAALSQVPGTRLRLPDFPVLLGKSLHRLHTVRLQFRDDAFDCFVQRTIESASTGAAMAAATKPFRHLRYIHLALASET